MVSNITYAQCTKLHDSATILIQSLPLFLYNLVEYLQIKQISICKIMSYKIIEYISKEALNYTEPKLNLKITK